MYKTIYLIIKRIHLIFDDFFLFIASLDAQLLLEQLQPDNNEGRVGRIQLLDLKHSDSRPDLVRLRNDGVKHFIVDIGADLLNIFFDQVGFHIVL